MSKRDELARWLRKRRGQWVSALEVARVAGLLSHSQRVSELRTRGMAIENRTRVIKGQRRSEYRHV